jgi:hypothetical protein
MNLIALYLTAAPDLPKTYKCLKCVEAHTIKGSYIQVSYCTVCNRPMDNLTKRYTR